MNKTTKKLFNLFIGSIIVWMAVIMVFADEIVFAGPDASTGDQGAIPDDAELTDGVFTGSAAGHNGAIVVEVTIADGKIVDVAIVEHAESEGISDPAIEGIPAAIIEHNSTDVDVVAGATASSRGIIAAVNNALEKSIGESAND